MHISALTDSSFDVFEKLNRGLLRVWLCGQFVHGPRVRATAAVQQQANQKRLPRYGGRTLRYARLLTAGRALRRVRLGPRHRRSAIVVAHRYSRSNRGRVACPAEARDDTEVRLRAKREGWLANRSSGSTVRSTYARMSSGELRWTTFAWKLSEGWWPGTELNRRHFDFQSNALPTELPGR
jgi:hypothetical protein